MDYTIKRGDTLSELARKFNTSVQKLADDNHLANPNLIHEGATLHVPEASGSAKPAGTQPLAAPQEGTGSLGSDQARVSRAAGGTMELHQGIDLVEVERRSRGGSAAPVETMEVHRGSDLVEVAARARAAQAIQPPAPAEDPQLADIKRPEPTAPVEDPELADIKRPEPPLEEDHKNWFDRLVEGGEDLVGNTVGQIPLIGGLFTASAQVTGGAVKAVGDMVGGVATAVMHPINTLKGLWGLTAHIPFSPPNLLHLANEAIHGKGPSEMLQEEGQYLKGLWNGLTSGYQQSIKDGRWAEVPGRLVVDVGSLLIGAGEATGAAKGVAAAGKAGEVAADAGRAAKVAEVAADAGKAVKVGEAAGDAGKAAELAGDAAKAAEVAGKTGRVARAVEVFKASAVGKATLDVTAGLQLMGETVSDFGKAVWSSLRQGAGKLPAKELQEAESLAARADALAKDFQEASKLSGEAGFQRMRALSKEASAIADQTEKLGKANKGLRGMAQAMKSRVGHTVEAFGQSGGGARLADLGTLSVETAKALGQLGLEAGKVALQGARRLPGAVIDQLKGLGTGLASLSERAKAATALKGEQAASKLGTLADEAGAMARQATILATQTSDRAIAELAQKLGVEEANLRRATAIASLGIPLSAVQGGLAAEERPE